MNYFFSEWKRINKRLTNKKRIFFFDYDGTLTPIVKKPEYAKLDSQIKWLLKKLSEKYTVAIISGRPLYDIKKQVGLKNIIYSGNHGFEIETQINTDKKHRFTQIFIHPEAQKIKPIIQRIRPVLEKKIKNIKGAFVENKGLILSIHWRLVDKRYIPKLFVIIREVIRTNSRVVLTKGKKVWEIRPNINWDKGKAVRFILSLFPLPSSLFPVYIGDDTTDEDAFKMLKNGITVRIGKLTKSNANYYLKNQSEIIKFLKTLSPELK
ncbi:MAG: trehalose-phosphatase [Elusimicrobiota bacterium]